MSNKTFEPATLGPMTLSNHIVMAPMTRSRAPGGVPNEMMATYYGQRANAGLIVTEGTSPAPEGLGYARIPGLYNREHVAGWRRVTDAVHKRRRTHFRSADAHGPHLPRAQSARGE